jgi:DNA-binding CsgD family transcriptional regulator
VAATQAASSLPFGAYGSLLPELTPGVDRGAVLRQVARAVEAQGAGKPVALLVDDAHLLDDASAALTHQLAASKETFVLATIRSGEPASDAVVALWKDGLAERLELTPFSLPEVEDLLATVLGGPVDGATVRLLFERTEGNVLFLRELVRTAVAGGVLSDEGGLWRLHGRLPASDRLVELVETRLAGLATGDRAVLEVLALGEPLGVELVADGEASLAALERRGLARIDSDGRRLQVRLAHPLYGDVLRSRLSPLRVRVVSRSLAEATTGAGARRRDDVLRVATWQLQGVGARDSGVMLAGARQAHARHDLDLAERLARASREAGGGFEAAFLSAQLVNFQGRVAEAESELAALAAQANNDAERGLVAVTRMDNLHFGLGRPDDALRLGEQAETEIGDRHWRHEIAARRATILSRLAGPRAALEAAEPVRREGEGRAYVMASYVAGLALARMGRTEAALELSRRAHDTHVGLTGPPLQWRPEAMLLIGCEALIPAGGFKEAEDLVVGGYRRAVAEGSTEIQGLYAWELNRLYLARGHVGTAARYGREAAALFRELRRLPFLGYNLGSLAAALALGGRVEEASAALCEMEGINLPPRNIWAVDAFQGRAWTAVAAGDVSRARHLLEEAAALGEDTGDMVGRLSALHDLARLGHAKEVARPLGCAAAEVEGEFAPFRAAHAAALAGGDGAALEQASAGFEALGADLLGAEAAADAAVAWRKAGNPRKAAAAETRAHVLAARCQGARTPALGAVGARAALTARELEIARLAAAGVANKEIAARLFLSLHTVQNKLHAAYEKLGVEGRAELARALEGY